MGLFDLSSRVRVTTTNTSNSFNSTWNRMLDLGSFGDINLSLGGGAAGSGSKWLVPVVAAGLLAIGFILLRRR